MDEKEILNRVIRIMLENPERPMYPDIHNDPPNIEFGMGPYGDMLKGFVCHLTSNHMLHPPDPDKYHTLNVRKLSTHGRRILENDKDKDKFIRDFLNLHHSKSRGETW